MLYKLYLYLFSNAVDAAAAKNLLIDKLAADCAVLYCYAAAAAGSTPFTRNR